MNILWKKPWLCNNSDAIHSLHFANNLSHRFYLVFMLIITIVNVIAASWYTLAHNQFHSVNATILFLEQWLIVPEVQTITDAGETRFFVIQNSMLFSVRRRFWITTLDSLENRIKWHLYTFLCRSWMFSFNLSF